MRQMIPAPVHNLLFHETPSCVIRQIVPALQRRRRRQGISVVNERLGATPQSLCAERAYIGWVGRFPAC
jgi:hypothetical protein